MIRKYLEKEENYLYLQEAKMKEDYGSRLPVLEIQEKNQIIFLRPENFSQSQVSNQKNVARAELYKRYPLLDVFPKTDIGLWDSSHLSRSESRGFLQPMSVLGISTNEGSKKFLPANKREGFVTEYGTIPQRHYLRIKKAQEEGKTIRVSEFPYTKKEILLKTQELLLTFSNRDGEWFIESSKPIDAKQLNQLMLKYKIDFNLKK